MKKRILLISLALLLAVSVVAIGCPPAPAPAVVVPWPGYPAPQFRWRVQGLWAAGLEGHKLFVEFAENVKRMSGGRLVIKPFPCGAITGPFGVFDAVRGGVMEGFLTATTYWTGREPAFAVLGGMPMGFPYTWQFDAWYRHGGGLELSRELHARFDLFAVGAVPFGPDSMHFRRPVTTVADLKGLKFRSMPGMGADLMRRLGAAVVIMPGGEIYAALAAGTIDGADFMTLSTNKGLGFHEVARYFITHGLHQPVTTMEFVVGMDEWKALPASLRAIVETAVGNLAATEMQALAIADRRAEARMLARGNVLLDFPAEERAKALKVAKEVWADWAGRSPMARRITDSQMAFKRVFGVIK